MSANIFDDPIRDAELKVWISGITAGGRVSSVEHVSGSAFRLGARLQLAGGNHAEIFLKIDLGCRPSTGYDLAREHEILRRLEGTPVRAPRLLGFNAALGAMAMECLGGTARYDAIGDDAQLRNAVDQSFVEALTAVHRINVSDLKLHYLPPRRTTAEAIAADLEFWRTSLFEHVPTPDGTTLFAFAWLAARMPTVERLAVLVQGDAGPGNFMFDCDGVTGLVDWEMAHIGHPLEDLGAVLARSLMQPMMTADRLLELYEAASGARFGRDELIYATILVMTRFNVPILMALENHTTSLDYGLTSSYFRLSQISMLTLIAAAEEIAIDEASSSVGTTPSIQLELDYLSGLLRDLIRPRIEDDYGRYRLDGGIALIDYLKRATGHAGSSADETAASRFNAFAGVIAEGRAATGETLQRLLGETLNREQLMTGVLGPLKGRRVRI